MNWFNTTLLWFSVCWTGEAVKLFYHRWLYHRGDFSRGHLSGHWGGIAFSVQRFYELEGFFQPCNSNSTFILDRNSYPLYSLGFLSFVMFYQLGRSKAQTWAGTTTSKVAPPHGFSFSSLRVEERERECPKGGAQPCRMWSHKMKT